MADDLGADLNLNYVADCMEQAGYHYDPPRELIVRRMTTIAPCWTQELGPQLDFQKSRRAMTARTQRGYKTPIFAE